MSSVEQQARCVECGFTPPTHTHADGCSLATTDLAAELSRLRAQETRIRASLDYIKAHAEAWADPAAGDEILAELRRLAVLDTEEKQA